MDCASPCPDFLKSTWSMVLMCLKAFFAGMDRWVWIKFLPFTLQLIRLNVLFTQISSHSQMPYLALYCMYIYIYHSIYCKIPFLHKIHLQAVFLLKHFGHWDISVMSHICNQNLLQQCWLAYGIFSDILTDMP